MARRSGFSHLSGRKRTTTWSLGTGGVTQQAIITTGKTLLGSGIVLVTEDTATIVRTHGYFWAGVQQASAALDGFIGAFGIGLVSDQAFAAGIASIPTPFTDAEWDGWFLWGSFSLAWDFDDATGVRFSMLNHIVDSKAMRKVSDNETIVLVAESQSGAFDISMPLRMLLKLS